MIRAVVLASLTTASGALACATPPSAIPLAADADGAPVAFAQMDALPLSAPFAITITFCGASYPANAMMFDAQMPTHRHGMNFTVDVKRITDNQFEVSNVVFHMPGLWEMWIDADVGGQRYGYRAEVPVQ